MADPKVMGKPRSEVPPDWSPLDVEHVGEDIYVAVGEAVKVGGKGSNVLVYHWHMPSEGAHRWSLSACGLHDVVSVDPLTLDPSLACEDGCPSHGYIREGVWRPV